MKPVVAQVAVKVEDVMEVARTVAAGLMVTEVAMGVARAMGWVKVAGVVMGGEALRVVVERAAAMTVAAHEGLATLAAAAMAPAATAWGVAGGMAILAAAAMMVEAATAPAAMALEVVGGWATVEAAAMTAEAATALVGTALAVVGAMARVEEQLEAVYLAAAEVASARRPAAPGGMGAGGATAVAAATEWVSRGGVAIGWEARQGDAKVAVTELQGATKEKEMDDAG